MFIEISRDKLKSLKTKKTSNDKNQDVIINNDNIVIN